MINPLRSEEDAFRFMLVVLVLLAPVTGTAGLLWLWAAFSGGFMLARAVTLGLRARGDAWVVLGAAR